MIISDGVSVRGINTAATLWCAAAVGALSASGFIWQAGVATAAILAINILLRPLGAGSTANPLTMNTEIETIYRFRATSRDQSEARTQRHFCPLERRRTRRARRPQRRRYNGRVIPAHGA